jgi:hypothetical protein
MPGDIWMEFPAACLGSSEPIQLKFKGTVSASDQKPELLNMSFPADLDNNLVGTIPAF